MIRRNNYVAKSDHFALEPGLAAATPDQPCTMRWCDATPCKGDAEGATTFAPGARYTKRASRSCV